MAFNIIAETSGKLNFADIHKDIYSENLPFNLFPMPDLGIYGGDAIGISVPSKNANISTWDKLKPILKLLKSKFKCDIFDLYGGQKLGYLNIGSFKDNLISDN